MANEFKVKKGLIVDGSGGTILDVQGSAGQLFSVTDSLTGDLFAVSDISGIPILNVNSSGAVDIDGDLSVTDDVTLSNFGAGYLKTNVNGVVSNTATIPWTTVSSTPTTVSGYGITDALAIGTTATTAMAGNTSLFDGAYGSLTGAPTLGTAAAAATGDFAAAAHDHSRILENATIAYGGGQLQWTDLNGNGGTGLNGAAPGNPFSDWFHHIIMNHANRSGYYVDIAACFHSDDLYFRRNVGGTLSAWREIYHTGNLTPLVIGTTASTAMAGNTSLPSTPGDVGLGNLSSSGNALAGAFTATGDITAFSDARVKENVETIPNALEKVTALRGVNFNKIGEEKRSTGVIAQEVKEVLPEVIHENEDGMLSVAYGNITGVLIEAIKEQQKQIEELKARLDGLTK